MTSEALVNIGGKNYHAKLTDRSGNAVGLNLVDASGNDNALEISQANHPRTPLQTSQGQGEYSDLLLPYKELVQGDWSGGRALLNARKDQTRYLDAGNLDTETEEQAILRGAPTYSTGVRAALNQSVPGSVLWSGMYGDYLYRSVSFVADGNISQDNIEFMIWLRRNVDETQDIHISICPDDGGGDPDYANRLGEANFRVDDAEANICECLVGSKFCNSGMTNGVTYHFVVRVANDGYDYWEVATVSGTGGKYSSDAAAWSAGPAPYFRVYDRSNIEKGEFFEYKGALYWVEYPNAYTTNSRIMINGDRGAADSNAGNLDRVVDGTKSWTADEFAGGIVMITAGSGRQEEQPWRTITGNDTNYLEVSPDWDITQDTTTEYVILGVDSWRLHATITGISAKDVEPTGEFVFFAGRANQVTRYNERNLAGTWTVSVIGSESYLFADIIKTINDPDDGVVLWGAYNDHDVYGSAVFKGLPPPAYSVYGLWEKVGILDQVDRPWDERDAGAATFSQSIQAGALRMVIDAAYGTGVLASKALSRPVDVTQANGIGILIESDIATGIGDLVLLLDDTPYCGKDYIPDYLLHRNQEIYPELFLYDASETGAAQWKREGNSEVRRIQASITRVNFTLAADDRIYIACDKHFDRIKWDISTAQTNVQTMSAKYWDGEAWTAVSGWSDGTASGGATLAQDGDMTFTLPTDWNPGTHGDQATYLDQSLYWIELTPSAALTNAKAELTVEDDRVAEFISLDQAKDGNPNTYETITITTDDYIYVGSSFMFERVKVNMGSTINAVASVLSAKYFNGATWETVAVDTDGTASGGATLAQDGTIILGIQSFDWHKVTIEGAEAYWIRFAVSVDLTPYINIIDITAQSNNPTELLMPALNAGEVTWLDLALTPSKNPEPDMSNVVSIGLRLDTDLGAQVIEIHGPIYITRTPTYIPVGNRNERITGLGVHGAERSNLMVHTESNIYEVQGENDNAVVELPLDEISSIKSVLNGFANCHNDVYHYFNLHNFIERYVDGSLENIGLDLDEGLPADRAGFPSMLLSHVNKVMVATNPKYTGPTTTDGEEIGISTIHARRGGGWHEIYRGPRRKDNSAALDYEGYYAQEIRSIYYQSSYAGPGRLWICQAGDLLWVPMVPDNPLNHSDFYYLPNGFLITGWWDASFIDIDKTFTHLKIASENLSANVTITAQYQLNSGDIRDPTDDANWSTISSVYNTSPSQRNAINTGLDIEGRRIRFRLIFNTNDTAITPVLKSTNVQLIFYHPVKEVYNLRYRSNDVGVSVDGQPIYTRIAATFDATVKTWASPPAKVLTLNCMHPSFDGKTVVVQYPSGKPFESNPGGPEGESLIRELVIMEV